MFLNHQNASTSATVIWTMDLTDFMPCLHTHRFKYLLDISLKLIMESSFCTLFLILLFLLSNFKKYFYCDPMGHSVWKEFLLVDIYMSQGCVGSQAHPSAQAADDLGLNTSSFPELRYRSQPFWIMSLAPTETYTAALSSTSQCPLALFQPWPPQSSLHVREFQAYHLFLPSALRGFVICFLFPSLHPTRCSGIVLPSTASAVVCLLLCFAFPGCTGFLLGLGQSAGL